MGKENGRRFPLSDVQRAYYLGRREEFELGGSSTHICYRFKTALDPDRLEAAMNRVIAGQEMLRAVIKDENGQEILEDPGEFKIKRRDLSGLSPEAAGRELDALERELFAKKTDPGVWPQYEFLYVSMPDGTAHLILSFDMLVADSSSLMLIAQELKELYEDADAVPVRAEGSYADYIAAAAERKKTAKYERDKAYWRERLDEIYAAPGLAKADTKEADASIKRMAFELPKERWQELKAAASDQGVTATGLVLAAYVKVLGQWAENRDFTVNLTLSERRRCGEMSLVGDYATAMLVSFASGDYEDQSLFSTAKTAAKKIMQTYRHNTYSGLEVMRDVSRERNLGTRAVMPIVFTSMLFKEEPFEILDFFGTMEKGISQTPQVILDCQATEYHGKLLVTWDYAADYVDRRSLEQMLEQMRGILCSPGETDAKKLFPLDSGDARLWREYNDTATKDQESKKKTLLAFLKDGFGKAPENIAVEGIGERITYAGLWEQSGAVQRQLAAEGIGPGDYVCVIARRDISTVINILGIVRSGAAYVPILEEYPAERAAYIEKKCAAKKTLRPFAWGAAEAIQPTEAEGEPKIRGDQAAYVIFTSGSTGEPKGVVITNEAVVNTLAEVNRLLGVTERDVFLGVSSLCFDLSVYDLFGCFGAGAKLVLTGDPREPEKVFERAAKYGVTIWNSVPALAQLVFDDAVTGAAREQISSVRYFMLSGDWIPLSLPGHLTKKCPGARVLSLGGATEASIWSIWYPVEQVESGWNSIPYGRPLPNQTIYVLDQNGSLCPPEVVGELCIGGVGVAAGYLNDEERTRAQFVEQDGLGRIYRTGDYGVLHRRDGQVEFLGRRDQQVKINGFRIEIGEIESAILSIPGVKDAQVLAGGEKLRQILAFFIGSEELCSLRIRDILEEKLPSYMVPASIERLEEFPLTANGKVDRKKLLELAGKRNGKAAAATKQEKMVLDIWSQALGLPPEEIDCGTNFFALGGDSIKAIQILSALKRAGYTVEMKDLYTHATVSLLAAALKKGEKRREYRPVEGVFGLTPSQKWFFEKIHHGREQFNQWIRLEWKGRLDGRLVRESLEYLVTYHDTLRITLKKTEDGYVDQYGDPQDPGKYFYFSELQGTQNEGEESQKLQRRFDLENGALIAVVLAHGEERDTLRLVLHHLLSDGVTMRILLADFQEIYRSLEAGERPEPCQPQVSYMDWAREAALEEKKVTQEERAYWERICREGKALNNGLFHKRSGRAASCTSKRVELPMPICGEFTAEEMALSGFIEAVHGATGCQGLMAEVEYHGRDTGQCGKELGQTAGWFSYCYPVVIRGLGSGETIGTLVRAAMREAPLKGKNFSLLRASGNFGMEKTLIQFNYLGNLDASGYGDRIAGLCAGQDMSPDCEATAAVTVVAYEKEKQLVYELTFDETVTGIALPEKIAERMRGGKRDEELETILEQLYG